MSVLLFGLLACSTGNNGKQPDEMPPEPPRIPMAAKIPGEMELIGETVPNPRSILIISWDTVRGDTVGLDENPGIQLLQSQSKTYTQAMTHFPETGISHWSLFTGVEPEIHGNVPGTGGSRYRGPTLAEIAKKFGYKTAAFIGGVTLTDHATGLARGFDRYDDQWDWMRKDVRPAKEITQRAEGWMRQQEGPYFAFVHFFEAHHPYENQPPFHRIPINDGPRPQAVEAEYAKYKGEIAYLDSLLPNLIQAAGEDTIIVLTSDHGESFEHDYLYNHRDSLWESTMNVPLLIRGPGMTPNTRSDQLVALTDIFPTVLDLAGLPQEKKAQGNSLLGEAVRETVYALTDPWIQPNPSYAIRSKTHKLLWQQGGAAQVFDMSNDRAEEINLQKIPDALQDALAENQKRIKEGSRLQREALPSRFISNTEAKKLESLGYLDPTKAPQKPGP